MLVQPQNHIHNQVDDPLRELGYNVHGAGRGVGYIVGLGLMDHIHDFFMIGIHGILGVKFEIRQAFLRPVVEFLFDGKGNRNVILLVEPAIADKTVHPGPKHESLAGSTADHMEEGILILCAALVLFLQVRL